MVENLLLSGLQESVCQWGGEDGSRKRLREESAAELEALLPAVLDRAFKGEL